MVASEPRASSVLEVRDLNAGYGGRPVIYDVALDVREGEIVAILGSNGAGKSTTLKSIVGLVRPLSGSVSFRGAPWRTDRPWLAAKSGLSFIPAERFTFASLTVHQNLMLGSYRVDSESARTQRLEQVYQMFPILASRSSQLAGTMSGGEQRMLSIGVAMMAGPRVLLLDEPSLGLAPVIVDQIFGAIGSLSQSGEMSVLLVEQNIGQVLRYASRCYVMRSGRIILEESGEGMKDRRLWDLF